MYSYVYNRVRNVFLDSTRVDSGEKVHIYRADQGGGVYKAGW